PVRATEAHGRRGGRRHDRQPLSLRHLREDPGRHPRGGPGAREVVMHPLERRRGDDPAATVGRRSFLKAGAVAAGAALVVEFRFLSDAFGAGELAPNAFVRITPDNLVTITAKHLEMGQGCNTGLATVLAEELDADGTQVRVESAPADAARYNNLFWGPVQGTGGSSSIANSWTQLRKAGATARAMLVGAAAEKWSVPPRSLTVDKGVVAHPATGRKATFGELASAAAARPVPDD